jgi:GNAT superfamily N-acetyltransferase
LSSKTLAVRDSVKKFRCKTAYAIIVFYWSNEYGGDFIEVDELFVDKDYRGNEIATAFFEWLEQTWHQKAVALSIQVTPANDRALTFYKRIGFETSSNRHLMKLLSGNTHHTNGG